jgi:sulfate adenylyltransferase large subunit
MSLLRFSTAGSVDDGKSTLIGRLLYDSKGVYEDQLASVAKASVGSSGSSVGGNGGKIDLALLTDGLRAEREQGITIDVAYRYFSTPKRKFIIADTPGHEQYTRNMATGASTADLAIILIDARNGVLQQSRRHAFIANLLGIRHFVVAINKMDLVGFDESVYDAIRTEFTEFLRRIGAPGALFIPISARDGDNVVDRSTNTPWYGGPALLDHLETVAVDEERELLPARFPVQYVVRPNLDFRGFSGLIAPGAVQPGRGDRPLPTVPRTQQLRWRAVRIASARSVSSGATTAIMPTPMLNTRSISAASIRPSFCTQGNTPGTCHEPRSSTTCTWSGTILARFSTSPPPVMWAMP